MKGRSSKSAVNFLGTPAPERNLEEIVTLKLGEISKASMREKDNKKWDTSIKLVHPHLKHTCNSLLDKMDNPGSHDSYH